MIRRLLRRVPPVRYASGGELPPYIPRKDSQLIVMSPGVAELRADQDERGTKAFWKAMTKLANARQTILCPPDMVESVRAAVDAHQLGGLVTVAASAYCPEGRLIVVDESGMTPGAA